MLTDEDNAIFARLRNAYIGVYDGMLARASDNVDFRAMLAREVHSEREWRIHNHAVTPVLCAVIDDIAVIIPGALTVREIVERDSGEALA